MYFQNIYILTYQKTLLHTLWLLVFKIVERLQCIFNWKSRDVCLTYCHFKYRTDKSQTVKLFFISRWKIADRRLLLWDIGITAVVYRLITIQLEPNPPV